jgi:hypothetical protein
MSAPLTAPPLLAGAPVLAVVPNGPALRGIVAACADEPSGRHYLVQFAQGVGQFSDHQVFALAALGDRPPHAFAAGGDA